MRRRSWVIALGALGMVASACGSTSSSSATTGTTSPTSTSSGITAASATVHVATVSGLGRILVDATGRTLYLFTKDDRSKVTCTGACTSAWPPLVISGHATAGAGVTASLLGTDPGPGGHPVATYGGWPLYTFAGDTAAGQAVGEGLDEFGGHWYAVTPSGTEAGAAASNAPTTTSGAGGY